MSSEDNIPQQDPAEDLREITVKVPAHRIAQFERFHQRFLAMAAHWDSQVGNEDVSGRRGRRGRRHHGHRCGHHRTETDAAA